MTSSKLAIADKQEILRLYCETDLSTAMLSKKFGISPSTTLRLLQEMMSPEEYRDAVQKKQGKPKKRSKSLEVLEIDQLDLELSDANLTVGDYNVDGGLEASDPEPQADLELQEVLNETDDDDLDEEDDDLDEEFDQNQLAIAEDLVNEEDLANELVNDDILDLDDDEFDEDEDESEEDDDEDLALNIASPSVPDLKLATNILTVLPLEQAELSNICYIVVDKASEVVTRPMRDFKELGKVPSEEINLLALPVFDNHRAARRFSAHNQKVIKFPSSLIHATKSHLSQKGITRMLYGGQIFALG